MWLWPVTNCTGTVRLAGGAHVAFVPDPIHCDSVLPELVAAVATDAPGDAAVSPEYVEAVVAELEHESERRRRAD